MELSGFFTLRRVCCAVMAKNYIAASCCTDPTPFIYRAQNEAAPNFRRNACANMLCEADFRVLAGSVEAAGRWLVCVDPTFHNCRQLAMEHDSEDLPMSVVPSIIVLAITALLVFRRELTTGRAATASKRTPRPRRRW